MPATSHHFNVTLATPPARIPAIVEDATFHLHVPSGESFTLLSATDSTATFALAIADSLSLNDAEEWAADLAQTVGVTLVSVVPASA